MHHGETPRRRHDHDGHAIGEAQQRRNAASPDYQRIGSLLGLRASLVDKRCGCILDAYQRIAVHLVRHDEPGIRSAKSFKQDAAVLLHGRKIVLHVGT